MKVQPPVLSTKLGQIKFRLKSGQKRKHSDTVTDEGYEKHKFIFNLKSSKMSSSTLYLKGVLIPLIHMCIKQRISKDKRVHNQEMITAYVSPCFFANNSSNHLKGTKILIIRIRLCIGPLDLCSGFSWPLGAAFSFFESLMEVQVRIMDTYD